MMEVLLNLAIQHGPSIIISIYLIYWLTQKLDKKLCVIIRKLDKLIEKIDMFVRMNCRCGEHESQNSCNRTTS